MNRNKTTYNQPLDYRNNRNPTYDDVPFSHVVHPFFKNRKFMVITSEKQEISLPNSGYPYTYYLWKEKNMPIITKVNLFSTLIK